MKDKKLFIDNMYIEQTISDICMDSNLGRCLVYFTTKGSNNFEGFKRIKVPEHDYVEIKFFKREKQ